MHSPDRLTKREWRAAAGLAGIYSTRMLGLFMILPVFALFAETLPGATASLSGLAIGIYGLSQAMLQIPLGMLSDRWGRKPVIMMGLVMFAIGSVLASFATSIETIIIGRFLQGSGAIAAATMALAADLTREEHRAKVNAAIGMSIGVSFLLAMILGPVIHAWQGISAIFGLTAVLAMLAMISLWFIVPNPQQSKQLRDVTPVSEDLLLILKDMQLQRLNLGIFIGHAVMTANFTVVPLLLKGALSMPISDHWMIYLPVLVGGFMASIPLILIAEKRRQIKFLLALMLLALMLSEVMMAVSNVHPYWLVAGLALFFWGFNFTEAVMPSLVAKICPPYLKGTAMGVYTTSQFSGIFVGGSLGGLLHQWGGSNTVFWGSAILLLLWWLAVITMKQPRYLSTMTVSVTTVQDEKDATHKSIQLTSVNGVAEAYLMPGEARAYLKVDLNALDKPVLMKTAEQL